ncbi:MAG: amine dehydrogenase [Alphaproteobacteria bacterium]|nr:amine dehydrogenase [Alphaproteobacteria bacterium]
MALRRERGALLAICAAALCLGLSLPVQAQLPIEPTPNVNSLPEQYPKDWIFIVDPNFFAMEGGKVVIADIGASVRHEKGLLSLAQFGFFAQAKTRPELYTVETFYSRGSRGVRTDVLTIYDKSSLREIGEIVLPGAKRAQILTESGAFQLSADEKFAYVFNFTPAASVTVVDLVNRRIVGDIDIPGCTDAYPLGGGGFASFCGNGAVATTHLDAQGKLISQSMSEPFQNIDEDPIFTRPTIIDGVGYFPSYGGRIQPIDFNGAEAVPGEAWTIEPPKKKRAGPFGLFKSKGGKSARGKWLPSGWQLEASDKDGLLYILMRKNATPDDHDTGAKEVWVIDPKTHETIRRIKLKEESALIEVTKGDTPYLAAFRLDGSFDVFDAQSGKWLRRIGGQMVITPFAAYGAE